MNGVELSPAGFETAKALFALKYNHRPARAVMALVNYESLKSKGWALELPSEAIALQQSQQGDLIFVTPNDYALDEFELEFNGQTERFKIQRSAPKKNLLANVDYLMTEFGRSMAMLKRIRAELAEQEQKKAQ